MRKNAKWFKFIQVCAFVTKRTRSALKESIRAFVLSTENRSLLK